jgi:prepilin signal peptidase PulO-like enzyme (type II secretory pathway)
LLTGLIFLFFLTAVSITDYRQGYIFDAWLLPFALAGILLTATGNLQPWSEAAFGAATGGGTFALIRVLSRGGMGGGDVKLSLVLGLWLGVALWSLAVYVAFLTGTAAALYAKFVGGRKSIPFAPCLSLGACLSFFRGDEVIGAYVEYFDW